MYAAGVTGRPQKPGSLLFAGVADVSPPLRFPEKPPNDHMLDHNGNPAIIADKKAKKNTIFPGVAQG